MRLFKLARRSMLGFRALVQVIQSYRAFTWLRDYYDSL